MCLDSYFSWFGAQAWVRLVTRPLRHLLSQPGSHLVRVYCKVGTGRDCGYQGVRTSYHSDCKLLAGRGTWTVGIVSGGKETNKKQNSLPKQAVNESYREKKIRYPPIDITLPKTSVKQIIVPKEEEEGKPNRPENNA